MSSIQLQIYDFAMAAGGSFPLPVAGSYFRILTTTGDVDVIGDTFGRLGPISRGQGLAEKQYGRLTIQDKSGAPNSGTILVSDANFIDQTLYGSIVLSSAVDLSASTLAALEQTRVRPESGTAYTNNAALTANTPITVFTPAANLAGAIVQAANIGWQDASLAVHAFISKTSAPSSVYDGRTVLRCGATAVNGGATSHLGQNSLNKDIYIPAGEGLYFISTTGLAAVTPNGRDCIYKLL